MCFDFLTCDQILAYYFNVDIVEDSHVWYHIQITSALRNGSRFFVTWATNNGSVMSNNSSSYAISISVGGSGLPYHMIISLRSSLCPCSCRTCHTSKVIEAKPSRHLSLALFPKKFARSHSNIDHMNSNLMCTL